MGWNKKVKLTDVSLKSPENLGAETLAKAASISSSARLWDIVRGLPYDVFIDRAWVDYTLSASGQIKWKQLLDYVMAPLMSCVCPITLCHSPLNQSRSNLSVLW